MQAAVENTSAREVSLLQTAEVTSYEAMGCLGTKSTKFTRKQDRYFCESIIYLTREKKYPNSNTRQLGSLFVFLYSSGQFANTISMPLELCHRQQ